MNVFAGYNSLGGLGNQSFSLLVSTLTNATFTSLGTFSYTPATASGAEATEQALASSAGPIASGVTGVEFVFNDPTAIQPIAGNDNKGTVYREVDVIGTPTTAVPEPATLGLIGVAAAAGLAGRRRRAGR